MKKSMGFTLIELIVVIVILGILAATALPRFIDFSGDAADAAVLGVAGGIASGSTINYAGRALSKPGITPPSLSGTDAAAVCSLAGGVLQGGLPAGYSLTAAGTAPSCGAEGYLECVVTNTAVNPQVSATAAVTCYP